MIRNIIIYSTIILLILVFIPILKNFTHSEELNNLAESYVAESTKDLNSQNIVTSVIVTYRGLDTLGEVTVLFLATAGVGFLMRKREKSKEVTRREASEILQTSSNFLFPLTILFGIYIFTHGHLTPGGGFQGGVLIASAFVLVMLSNVSIKINQKVLHLLESFSGSSYVVIGVLGLILAGGFLDPRFLPLGKYGTLLSAGAIPLIYSFIGLKVGAELTNVLDNLREDK